MLEKFKDTKLLLAHSVILTNEEIAKIKQLSEEKNIDLSISHCPISNLKLGCGIANISKMIEEGINVSLGTDGQGSGSNLDMFETMKFAALLQKGNMKDAKLMKAYDVLKLATINGAKALGLENKILIVGLGLLGGSYAQGLTDTGFTVGAIDVNQESIALFRKNPRQRSSRCCRFPPPRRMRRHTDPAHRPPLRRPIQVFFGT